ncbi:MAG: galactokinase family protein, partial [Spirochaetota bacterium]
MIMKAEKWLHQIDSGNLNTILAALYGANSVRNQKERYKTCILQHKNHFDPASIMLFSTPGRTELGGNHTDHNHGRVLAASVQLDSLAVAAPSSSSVVEIISEGYTEKISVDLGKLERVREEEGKTESLVRGIAARLHSLGYKTGGFKAYIQSNVLRGSGLSSSASIEVLLGTIFNHLFNDGTIDILRIAQVGQYAENNYFGKPCGLMDQVACGCGGIVVIDFEDLDNPSVGQLFFNFEDKGYALAVVDTGGSHENLTPEYASIPDEMKSVAREMGREFLRGIPTNELISRIPKVRSWVGDRAVLRCLHFILENDRVIEQVEALREDRIEDYLKLVRASGDSSWKLLQNSNSPRNPREQGLSLALALTEIFLNGKGACRVHGGGFAGTIQV